MDRRHPSDASPHEAGPLRPRRLGGLVEAGVRHLSFGPPLGPEPLAALELLGREVLPAFREGAEP